MTKIITLDTNVRLILEPMNNVRSVSIGIWCDTGAANESPAYEGISHFIEHMLFKGTTHRSTFDIVNDIDKIGGQMNAFTGKESTCFYVKSLDEHFDACADVLVDMICHPLFDAAEMEKEKQVVIEEINMTDDDPDEVSLDQLENAIFMGSTMQHPVLGSKETVSSFTPDIVREYYMEHYSRDAIVISVAGSFDEEHVIDFFSDKFTELHATRTIAPKDLPVFHQENTTILRDIEQAHIALGIITIPATDSRRYAMSILNNLFGGGMSSRLFQHVREKKGLAYSVYSMNGFYTHTGMFVISAGVAADKAQDTLDAIREELDILASEPIRSEELESSREQLKASFIFSQESVQSRMMSNGRNLLGLGCCRTPEEVLRDLNAITLEDVEAVKELITDYTKYSIINVTGGSEYEAEDDFEER